MGLGISIRARLPRSGPSGPELIDLIPKLAHEAEAFARSRELSELLGVSRGKDTLSLQLHPAEQPVEVEIASPYVTVEANTSNGGPGYHVYVCELLDRWAEACGLQWESDNDRAGDDTSYFTNRSLEAVQGEMSRWLRSLSQVVAERRRTTARQIVISFESQSDFRPVGVDGIITPRGPRDVEWFEAVASADPDNLRELAAEWFTWWGREADAPFWLRTGLGLMWVEVPWCVPLIPQDERICRQALLCFDRARRLQPDLALPEAEIAELKALIEGDPDNPPPISPCGIGYRRGLCRMALPGRWTIVLPGYFQPSDDKTLFYSARGPVDEVHVTAFSVQEMPRREIETLGAERGEIVERFETEDLVAVARLIHPTEPDRHFTLQAIVGRDGGFVLVTIVFGERSALDQALAIFRSVRHSGMAQ